MVSTSARDIALRRIEFVFGRARGGVLPTDRFDVELKGQPPNDFRLNEFDQLLEDALQMLSDGSRFDSEILTVDEFCELAERYSRDQPQGWASLTEQWRKEKAMASAPGWRRAVWRWIGF